MTEEDHVVREQLLRRAVLAGDEQAWRTWYDAEFARLLAYARWRCGGLRDLADEVVQEAWLVAVRRVRDFDPERATFGQWLRGIVARLLQNRLRLLQRRNGKPPPTVVATAEPADAEMQKREQAEGVARALASLPEHYEAVLRAKYLDELSVQAIAEVRQETPKAVESLLTRARQAFREAYDQRDNDEHP
jgi:RNA polymerase sigma-70 factor (ECF subfamily)